MKKVSLQCKVDWYKGELFNELGNEKLDTIVTSTRKAHLLPE